MLELNHHYVITLRKATSNEGGGYVACIPQLGFGTFNAQADTVEETIDILNDVYSRMVELLDESGWDQPEPIDEWEISQRVNPPNPYSPFRSSRTKVSPHELTVALKELSGILTRILDNPDMPNPDMVGDELNETLLEAYKVNGGVQDLISYIERSNEQYLRWVGK